MRRVLAVAVCALAACGAPKGPCGGSTCASNQRCDWTSAECVDDLAPRLTVSWPLDGSIDTANMVSLQGVASDDDGVPTVEYSFDGQQWTTVKTADGVFDAPLTLPAVNGAPLRLTVRATDSRGQVTTQVIGLSVDDVPPSCARLSPDDGAVFTGGAVPLRFSASGYRTLELTVDGMSVTPRIAAGELLFPWPVPLEDWVVHTLKFAVTDAAGNSCLLESTFIVDDVPPQLSFESPLDGQVFGTNDFGIAFANGPATDGSGVVNVFVDVDDGLGMIQSGVWGDHWIVGRDAPEGEDYVPHYARAIGVDLAGNSRGIDVTWFADVVAPRLMITSPSPGQVLNASKFVGTDDVTVSWTVADGDPQLMVTSPQAPGQTFLPPAMSFPFTTSPTDNGTAYMVQLTASTRSGSTTGTVSFTVDRVGPSVVSATPPLGSRMVDGPVVVTFSEPMQQSARATWNDAGTIAQLELFGPDRRIGFPSGSAQDLAGNALAGDLNWRIRPGYWNEDGGYGADAGLVDMPGAQQLWAAADKESVLGFAVHDGVANVNWFRIEPLTGDVVTDLQCPQVDGGHYQVAGYLRPDATVDSERLFAFSCRSDPSVDGYTSYANGHFSEFTDHQAWLFLVWPYNGEDSIDADADAMAELHSNGGLITYHREPGVDVVAPVAQVSNVQTSSTHWVVSESGATGSWAAFGCDAGACAFYETGALTDATGSEPYSLAVGAACDLHLFQSSNTDGGLALETIPWTAGCPSGGCVAVSTTPVPGSTGAVVFDPRDEVTFELISTNGATFDISTGTLDSACTPTLTHVSSFTVPQGLVSAQPVWMYGKPSALYLDGNGTVRLYVSP